MTTSEIIGVVQAIIYLGGLGGVVYWAGKWFHALKGAIEAQKTTIDAQRAIIEGMANFMNIADAPKMAERFEGYKKMVDLDYDARLKQIENRLLEENTTRLLEEKRELLEKKGELLQTTANLHDELEKVKARDKRVVPLVAEAILKLGVHYQLNRPEWAAQKHTYSARLAESIEAIMDTLPPPPPFPKTSVEIFWEEGKKHLSTQRALESKKDKPE